MSAVQEAVVVETLVAPIRAIIGLDLGTACGWAVRREAGIESSGVVDLKSRGGDPPGQRLRLFVHFVEQLVGDIGPTVVAYEKVRRHLGTDAAHVYGMFEGTLEWLCGDFGVRVVPLNVQEIKKFATGKGNADKVRMVAEARRMWIDWDRERYDHNEADARWIAELAWQLEFGGVK